MTAGHFVIRVESRLSRQPFHAFVIKLDGGDRIEVDHPSAIMPHESVAIVYSPGGALIFFDQRSVRLIITAPAHEADAWPQR